MHDQLIVRGAREHNLKGVDLDLPRDSMIVFTGLSGSGKSSLAFDTIFAEGQRRYVESLSSYARQFLGQMDKPDVDFIEGLSPAVSIDQKSTSRNPRSTVGTITEIHDYLRLLFARAGVAHCPECGARIQAQTPQQIVDRVRSLPEGTRFQVLSPVVRGRKGEYQDLLEELKASGYVRAIVDGQLLRLEDVPPLEKKLKHTIEVVVDRLVVREGVRQRLTDSVETALRLSDGLVIIDCIDLVESDPDRRRKYSEKRSCPNDHPLTLDEIEPRTFSFNAPYGACPECSGLGSKLEVDPELVVPDEELSLNQGAVIVWNSNFKYHRHLLEALSKELGFSMDTPWKDLPKKVKDAILNGRNYEVKVKFRNRWGRERSYTTGFEGALTYIQRKKEETESQLVVDRMDSYMREVPCSACQGARLRPEVLAVTIGDLSIAQLSDLSIRDAKDFLDGVTLEERSSVIAAPILTEIQARLNFLVDVGLSYLTLSRGAATLSGGEAQRIRLATQIGSGLVGVLYVLDEPSIGLHQRDNDKLIATLKNLRDLNNTVLVVEHDEDTIRAADWLVDVGPGAGVNGGMIVASGTPEEVSKNPKSLTGKFLSGEDKIQTPKNRRKIQKNEKLVIKNARENNLKNIDVEIPLGVMTVVSGVSGSGKSTLVNEILSKELLARKHRAQEVPGAHDEILGLEKLDKAIVIDQSAIGRTPRSNPATYTGVFTQIRELFAGTPEANIRGYKAGRFSFNVKGGRCENCQGDGVIKIEMHFLPDVYVECDVCHGKRYNREALEILYKGKTISDVLEMTIDEATEFFENIPAIYRKLKTIQEVGLGYIKLGQPATTFSGGEAQRIKLATELARASTGKTMYILDEPTTGLHNADVKRLLSILNRLVDAGNSMVIIEHNLDMVKSADWLIDMGPEGGAGGGTVVATGTPEQVSKVEKSWTGKYLKNIL